MTKYQYENVIADAFIGEEAASIPTKFNALYFLFYYHEVNDL
jgi:hypothetical protein